MTIAPSDKYLIRPGRFFPRLPRVPLGSIASSILLHMRAEQTKSLTRLFLGNSSAHVDICIFLVTVTHRLPDAIRRDWQAEVAFRNVASYISFTKYPLRVYEKRFGSVRRWNATDAEIWLSMNNLKTMKTSKYIYCILKRKCQYGFDTMVVSI